jgi:hypothetical protein
MGSEEEGKPSREKRSATMKIQWIENIESAMSNAESEHKHVLLDFHNPH